MLPECQKIQIRRVTGVLRSTDIVDFESAVVSTVSAISGEWKFLKWLETDGSNLVTFASADNRYVNISGDVMVGSLSSPLFASNTLHVGTGNITFYDAQGNPITSLSPTDITQFEETYTAVQSNSGRWNESSALSSLIIATNIYNGVVSKTYKTDVVPSNMIVLSAVTDTTPTNLVIHWDGPSDKWMGNPSVNGSTVPLSSITYLGNTSYSRRFSATVSVPLSVGVNYIPLDLENYRSIFPIQLLQGGPFITNVTFGSYPGTQTELKAGDTLAMTVTFASNDITQIEVLSNNNVNATNTQIFPVTAGNYSVTVNITIAGTTTTVLPLPVVIRARNTFGTVGPTYTSTTLLVNNVAPTFSSYSVTYPATQTAYKRTQTGTVNLTVSNQGSSPTYAYTFPGNHFSINAPTSYSSSKTLTCLTSNAYNVAGDGGVNNFQLSVTRNENGKIATFSSIVNVADIASVITITGTANPFRSGGTNGTSPQSYIITINSNQLLAAAPSLSAGIGGGTLTGAWSYSSSSKTFTNTLQVSDSDTKGNFNWTGLTVLNKSNIPTSSITGNTSYTLAGFVERSITRSAYSRLAPLGVIVSDASKLLVNDIFRGDLTLSNIVSGSVLNPDINIGNDEFAKFTVVDANLPNVVNINGDTIFYLDREAVGQNSGGTATMTIQETI